MIGWDTETDPFNDYCQAPAPVVLTAYSDTIQAHGQEVPVAFLHLAREFPEWVDLWEEGSQWFFAATGEALVPAALALLEHTLIAQNQPYDLGVLSEHVPGALELCIKLLDEKRGFCTQTREKLLAIADGLMQTKAKAKGYFSLAGMTKRYFGVDIEGKYGPDAWRTRYHELRGIPFVHWPRAAKTYAMFDAKYAFDVWGAQAHHYPTDAQTGAAIVTTEGYITDETRQFRADFALSLMSSEGVRVDPIMAAHTLQAWQEIAARGFAIGRAAGFVRHDDSKNVKALQAMVVSAYNRLGIQAPLTDTGKKKMSEEGWTYEQCVPKYVSYSNDTLAESGDEVLKDYGEASTYINYLSKFGGSLTKWASGVGSMPNVLVDTGRTSWSKPPRQQPPKKGGYRECHIPRPGFLISSIDYNQIELVCLAFVLEKMGLGSGMADDIRAGYDLHCVTGVALGNEDKVHFPPPGGAAEWTYENFQECRDGKHGELYESMANDTLRAMAKVANFGLPGGLGPKSLRSYAIQTYGLELSMEQAETLVRVYKESRPEMERYFRRMGRISGSYNNSFTVVQVGSMRVRGDCRYTSGCNTYFQGLAADGIKDAMWLLVKEMYLDRSSPLFGTRAWLMVHDEILFYHPEVVASAAAKRARDIMVAAMQELVPGVPVRAEPALCRRWYKKAEPVYAVKDDPNSELLPWEPKEKAA